MRALFEAKTFRGMAIACAVVLTLLLVPVAILPGEDHPDLPTVERALKLVRKERMPVDAMEQMTAGYYEDLFDFSSRTIATNRLITGKWATNWSRYQALKMNQTDTRIPGFLYYETLPYVDVKEFTGRLVTNQYGMADQEYTLAPPEGTRRLSVIGDSISRGLGASFGSSFEAIIEKELNETSGPQQAKYEILNFAVGGYRMTQLVWVLQFKASAFKPHVHLVAFSDLTVGGGKWSDHIAQLVHDGVDLHYPYLKTLAAKAQLRPDDDPQTFHAKMDPYHDEVITWALQEMRDSAREQGAELIVLMVPTVMEPDALKTAGFAEVGSLVSGMGIPLIDVTDTFAGIDDLTPYRISRFNTHPTDQGHALLAERLLERMRQNPTVWKIVTGQ